jgi:DNA-directed RNA polymerase subunit N (RpoN/RPB10)
MIIPIKCFNCGQILASKYKRYQRLLNASKLIKLDTSKGFRLYLPSELEEDSWEKTDEITKENRNNELQNTLQHIDTEFNQLEQFRVNKLADASVGTAVAVGNKNIEAILLDQLGLKRYCCRSNMISHIDILSVN